MTEPVGIQRTRKKVEIVDGVRRDLQWQSRQINGLTAKCVTRGTAWGNPFKIGGLRRDYSQGIVLDVGITEDNCLVFFEQYAKGVILDFPQWLEPLRGHNLACWCKEGAPCHRDILLKLLQEATNDRTNP